MAQQKSNFNIEEIEQIKRSMLARILNIGLSHLGHIGPRSLRALQAQNHLKDKVLPVVNDVDIAVLGDQNHARRLALPSGPLVLYLTDEDSPSKMLVELPELFFSDNRDVRQAALECLEEMNHRGSMDVTPKTAAILKENRNDLLAKEPEKWCSAAVTINDAFCDDILVSLQGVQQCLEHDQIFQDSLNFYAQKVFYPSVSSLDSIILPLGHPERDHVTLAKLLTDIVGRASSLSDLCSEYLTKMGYLPFAPPYSLAAAVKKWLLGNPRTAPWQEIWEWTSTKSTPISKYHACTVFVLSPELVPRGKMSDLWDEIIAVVQTTDGGEIEALKSEPWSLRQDLARHFTFYLEAHLPENDGANISNFAWWFAEQVAALLPDDADAAKFYRENWVKHSLEISSQLWLAASAPIQRSFLRYVTFSVQTPWAVALLTLMGEHLEELAPEDQEENVQSRFYDALVANSLSALPFPVETPGDPTFVLECSFTDTVLKWATHQQGEHRQALKELVETSRKLGTSDGICEALSNLGNFHLPDQIAICLALKTKVYIDPTTADSVWEVISDSKWRYTVLVGLDPQVQGLLIEALVLLLIDNRDKWLSHLPHYLAELCEKEENSARRRLLFLYVIHTSIASDTVSAVRRLLRGDQKEKFIELAAECRAGVDAMRSHYPPWVAGKMRGLMASLHVL